MRHFVTPNSPSEVTLLVYLDTECLCPSWEITNNINKGTHVSDSTFDKLTTLNIGNSIPVLSQDILFPTNIVYFKFKANPDVTVLDKVECTPCAEAQENTR
jgi:hypothetical protein